MPAAPRASHGRSRWWGRVVMAGLSLHLAGCFDKPEPLYGVTSAEQFEMSLPYGGKVFDLLIDDIDQDGREDITLIDHGGNLGKTFFQTAPRQFMAGPDIREVGFHPGTLLRWPAAPDLFVLSAEGGNSLVALEPKAKTTWLPSSTPEPKRDGFRVVSILGDRAPRYSGVFHWPGWGNSLVVTPFDKDAIFLLKQYDPLKGVAAERKIVLLDKRRPSVREANRVKAIDLDGDGVDELVYVTHITEEVFVLRHREAAAQVAPELLFENTAWGMPNEVHPLDLDGDGDTDLLVPDEAMPGRINILLNDGKGTFSEAEALPFPDAESPDRNGVLEMALGQDQDGHRYMLAAGMEHLSLYQVPEQWRAGTPMPSHHIKKRRENHSSVKLQDVDKDGWLDIVLGRGGNENNVWIVYGPLWSHIETMQKNGFLLK